MTWSKSFWSGWEELKKMDDFKNLIMALREAAERRSNSLNTRNTCRQAADAIEDLLKECESLGENLCLADDLMKKMEARLKEAGLEVIV